MMPGVAVTQPDGARGQPLESAVDVGHPEQQRHTGERQKQLDGKRADDGVERQPAEIHADDPRERK